MKNIILFCLIFVFVQVSCFSQRSFTTYYELSDMQLASPGAFKSGLYGFDNPAMLNYNHSNFDLSLLLSDRSGKIFDFERFGFFYGSQNTGFGIFTNDLGDDGYTDYRVSTGFGDRNFGLGFTYGWTNTKGNTKRSKNMFAIGALYRPIPYFSLGASYSKALDIRDAESVLEIGVRPLGNELVTLYADASQLNGQKYKDMNWSLGAIIEPLPGIRINARRFMKSEYMTIGVNFSLGNSDLTAINFMDSENERVSSTYGIRFGGRDRTIIKDVILTQNYLVLDISSNIKYVKNIFFDNSISFYKIIDAIDRAEKDKSVKGIVINATQASSSKVLMWEIRNKLEHFKNLGKRVVIFIERADLDSYHFASIADCIVLDPLGSVELSGYSLGRSFYKKLLEKSDIGYEEFRYFKYKSAAENYSRESFSEGDKEQRQRLIDDWYDLAKKDITKSRKNLSKNFDDLVNEKISYLAKEALENKLVDKFDRWNNLEAFMREYDRSASLKNIFADEMYPEPYDDKWSNEEKQIAVIYAEGVCDLNSGIQARTLSNILKSTYENNRIKAIVLRVDSPGGDAMASDYISEIIKKNKGKKPLVVSQGSVAASGGYWLSMEADKIVAAPNTISGSIGVISAWIYDKGLKDSMGITYDFVKKGKYSDIGNAFQLPLLPIGLPIRNLNEDEKLQRESQIKDLYKDFVSRVASARKMTYEKVDEVAQGRVWTGNDAKEKGLVDEVGGLSDAISLAKKLANIPEYEDTKIVQFPASKLFDFTSLFGGITGINIPKINDEFDELKFIMNNNGVPMTILSIDYWK